MRSKMSVNICHDKSIPEIPSEKSCHVNDLDGAENGKPCGFNSSTQLQSCGSLTKYVSSTPKDYKDSLITSTSSALDCHKLCQEQALSASVEGQLREKDVNNVSNSSHNIYLQNSQCCFKHHCSKMEKHECGISSHQVKKEDIEIMVNSLENKVNVMFQPVDMSNTSKSKGDRTSITGDQKTLDFGDAMKESTFSHCSEMGKKLIKCGYCSRMFKFQSQFIIHERIHTGEKPYSCPDCGRHFNKNSNLNLHLKVHRKNNVYQKCPYCPFKFATYEYKAHLKKHVTNEAQKVKTVKSIQPLGKTIACKNDSNENNVQEFGMFKGPVQSRRQKRKNILCQYCGKSFTFQSALARHIRVHTGEKPYKCDICGKAFGQTYFLRVHELTHWSVKRYTCTSCGKAFTHYSNAKNHTCKPIHSSGESPLNNKKGALTYTCHICKNVFDRLEYFKNHMKEHTGARLYHCLKCDKLFGVFAEFSAHKKHCNQKHSEDLRTLEITQYKGFKSLSEQNAFFSPNTGRDQSESEFNPLIKNKSLPATVIPAKHISNITLSLNKLDNGSDPRKYFCPGCGRLFRHLGRLRAHMLTHRRNQSYTCTSCGKTVENWRKLWQHQRIHRQRHGRFSCPRCGRGFRFLELYKKHMSDHPDFSWVPVRSRKVPLPYQCDQCQCMFTTPDLLTSHQRCHSPKDSVLDFYVDSNCKQSTKFVSNSFSKSSINSVPNENHITTYGNPLKQQTNQFSKSSPSFVRNISPEILVEKQCRPCDQLKTDSAHECLLGKPLVNAPSRNAHKHIQSSESAQCAICGQLSPTITDLYQHYLQHARGEVQQSPVSSMSDK